MLDCKAIPAPGLASLVLVVTVGCKVIPGPVLVWRVPVVIVGRRVMRGIRRMRELGLAAVELRALAVADRRQARAALGEGGAAVSSVLLELGELVTIGTQVADKFDSRINECGTPSMPVRPWLTSVEHVV